MTRCERASWWIAVIGCLLFLAAIALAAWAPGSDTRPVDLPIQYSPAASKAAGVPR